VYSPPAVPTELGRLERVDPRDVWEREARDFTPWLLANPDRLSEALGIELELEAAEHPVGGFSLDLIGRDITNDAILIVEDQLEGTDHSHLGQVLTYAAGTGAATIVWIAREFRPEHRQALDWLNENTGEAVHFFGIELQVVKIGASIGAPLLNVVAQPNDWQKQVRTATAGSVTGKGAHYVKFWERFLERVHAERPDWTRARATGPDNWLSMRAPIKGCSISSSFAQNARLRHELYIALGDAAQNEQLFEQLHGQKEDLEAAYGRPLAWEDLSGRKGCRIADYEGGCDVAEEERFDEFIDWFIDAGDRLRRALGVVVLTVAD
jgi:hypothetical protein